MPRLIVLVSAILYLDAALFGSLIPLLPGLSDDFDLSKREAGLLFAAYGAGAVIGGFPAGLLVTRVGPRTTAAVGSFVLCAATIGFALADGPLLLGIMRLVQGFASIATWSSALTWIALETPRERRGQALGTVFGVAIFGFIAGPVIGAVAHATSLRDTFVVIGVIVAVLGVAVLRQPPARLEQRSPGSFRRALSDPAFVAGLWLSVLPAFFFGVLDVLATLDLDAGGFGAIAVAAVFVLSGLLEVGFNPLVGRISDRRGRLLPIRVALLASILVAAGFTLSSNPYVVAALVIGASLSFGGFYTPGMALVSDRAETTSLPQGIGFGLNNTLWAIGAMLGPIVGGTLAQAAGDAVPYALTAVLCAATLVGLTLRTSAKPRPRET